MARFILDVMLDSLSSPIKERDIEKVLEVIERDKFISGTVASITCIDETCENQFYSWDEWRDKDTGKLVNTSPMMNKLSKKQIDNFNKELAKK